MTVDYGIGPFDVQEAPAFPKLSPTSSVLLAQAYYSDMTWAIDRLKSIISLWNEDEEALSPLVKEQLQAIVMALMGRVEDTRDRTRVI